MKPELSFLNDRVENFIAEGGLYHSILTDCPYHLTSITDRFGKEGSAPAQYGTDGAFQRASRGFGGMTWDGGGVSFDPNTWRILGNALYPGAFGMAFASSRGYHRMAVAIEDAGFIIHPAICWINGQSMPKATRIDTQIDRDAGADRKVVGRYQPPNGTQWNLAQADDPDVDHAEPTFTSSGRRTLDIEESGTELGREWQGHRYGGQALKSSAELICVFQKPYEGRPIDNITSTGAGAINIDRGRIGYESDGNLASNPSLRESINGGNGGHIFPTEENRRVVVPSTQGRWPSNVILHHLESCKLVGHREADSYTINRFTDGAKPFGNGAGHEFESEQVQPGKEEVWECTDSCPVNRMNIQTGTSTSGTIHGEYENNGMVYGKYNDRQIDIEGSEGFPSRFFYQANWNLENADPFFYASKVSVLEREAGLVSKDGERVNIHPTLKSLSLTSYLAGLLLPPAAYSPRRILVPFSGSGSECIGAAIAGWEFVQGIEMSAEYIEIAKGR